MTVEVTDFGTNPVTGEMTKLVKLTNALGTVVEVNISFIKKVKIIDKMK